MENTGKVLFEDDSPQWYIAMGSRWIGPLSASDVYHKVLGQEVTWAHFVWRPGQPDWKRICDVKTFQVAVPGLPNKVMQEEVKHASRPAIRTTAAAGAKSSSARGGPPPRGDTEERIWFLYYSDSQFGPFSNEEISRFLRVGKIHGRVHIWKDGMPDWAKLETISRFEEDVQESKKARELKKTPPSAPPSSKKSGASESKEQRKAPRRPLVAKILMADQEKLTVAVCRDISVGGMQVLTDVVPGKPGARIKMNVSSAGRGEKGGSKPIEPFVAEGVIVRILEDGRGFSFRFDKLPDNSRRAIEDYIRASA